jgi:hypothetical protein
LTTETDLEPKTISFPMIFGKPKCAHCYKKGCCRGVNEFTDKGMLNSQQRN